MSAARIAAPAVAGAGAAAAALGALAQGPLGAGGWALVAAAWGCAQLLTVRLAALPDGRAARIAAPLVFGATVLFLWEAVTRGAPVPAVLLPAPSAVAERAAGSLPILWADFRQTFLKGVLAGWVMGSGAGFLAALAIDRSDFLRRGLTPVAALMSALPIIGVAPIMVMWFGFDWHSKAAVAALMTFFPMLVNATAGLAAADAMQRDLMRTYAAGYGATLAKLRLPAAAPFLFTALKVNATLAMIGAIVAEFFGTPTVGMGFRISTEVGRMNLDMVWAQIAVAALAGSAFYGLIGAAERAVAFWAPAQRR